jgi:LacI family transcriptional regulator
LHHKPKVTIKDVAMRAGVSLMTVSRAMNNQGLVKDATRERVQKAISDLDYRPNLSARRLAGGKTFFIGLVYLNPSPGYLTQILLGAMTACRENSHHLVLEDLGQQAPYREPQKTAQHLSNAGLDGVLITPPLCNYVPFVSALEDLGITVVRISPKNIHTKELRVAMDDALAVKNITEQVIALGHRKIAIVKGHPDHPSAQHRYEGFIRTMNENGLSVAPEYIKEGDFTYRSGMNAAQNLMDLDTPPTAIFASNDDMAAGIVSAAHMSGLKVPKDISVFGFDDTEIATHIWPELTTVRQPIFEMSFRAIELLAAHIQGNAEEVERFSQLLDFEIIQRDSVAAPRVN